MGYISVYFSRGYNKFSFRKLEETLSKKIEGWREDVQKLYKDSSFLSSKSGDVDSYHLEIQTNTWSAQDLINPPLQETDVFYVHEFETRFTESCLCDFRVIRIVFVCWGSKNVP